MEMVAEFITDNYQYQEVSNSSWSMPMTGYRRRKLDKQGNAISEWEVISHYEYVEAYRNR